MITYWKPPHLVSKRPWIVVLGSTLFFASALFLASCGGGGGGGGGGIAGGSADVMIKDAPVDGLLALRATLAEVRLRTSSGQLTPNLIDAEIDLEFLGLEDRALWLGRKTLAGGAYQGAQVRFKTGSIEAVRMDGNSARVNVTSEELDCDFDGMQRIQGGIAPKIIIDLDVAESLDGVEGGGSIEFTPRGTVQWEAAKDVRVSPCCAELVSVRGAGEIEVDAFVDLDRSAKIGSIPVRLQPGVTVLDEQGDLWSREQLVEHLRKGKAALELQVLLDSKGRSVAEKVELRGEPGSEQQYVAIEGLVLRLKETLEFDLLVQEIKERREHAEQVLDALGNPDALGVKFDADTVVLSQSGELLDVSALLDGQRVKVQFKEFVASPFPVRKIEIIQNPSYAGRVVSTDSLPDRVIIHVRADDPAVVSGRIASDTTDVMVELAEAPIFFEEYGGPRLEPKDLVNGTKLLTSGRIDGPADMPIIPDPKVIVRPVKVEGCVLEIFPGVSRCTIRVARSNDDDDTVDDDLPSILEVQFFDATRFVGAAESEREFYDRFRSLKVDEGMQVVVRGQTAGVEGRIRAFRVKSEITDRLGNPAELWPPNHRLVTIDLFCDLQLRDDQGNPPADIRVDSITQDEPVNGKGDGNTAPDGKILRSDVIQVRSERTGKGNGRVYKVSFTAWDSNGDRYEDYVKITVPHSQNGEKAKNDGQKYDSTDGD